MIDQWFNLNLTIFPFENKSFYSSDDLVKGGQQTHNSSVDLFLIFA